MKVLARHARRKGVSEVVGALLLIVVVVAAVASLAIFLSEVQKDNENRSNYLTSVKDESLKFAQIQIGPNNPYIQWQLKYVGTAAVSGASSFYYVQIVNSTNIILNTTSVQVPANLTGGNSLKIQDGAAVSVTDHNTVRTDTNATFVTFGCTTSCWMFAPATWKNANLTIQNLNTESSEVYQVQINGVGLAEWDIYNHGKNATGPESATLAGSGNPVASEIPAKGSATLDLPLSQLSLTKNSPMKIVIQTQLGNFFTIFYSPPLPVTSSSIQNENYQVADRDLLTFNGGQSTANGTAIETYLWQLVVPMVAAGCTSSAFSNPANLAVAYAYGSAIQYTPESLFPASLLPTICAAGPVEATLTVVDSNGLSSSSSPIIIPADPDITPLTSLTFTTCTASGCIVTVTADNILGVGVNGIGITAQPFDGATVNASANPFVEASHSFGLQTGEVEFVLTGPGTVEISSGFLQPVYITVPS